LENGLPLTGWLWVFVVEKWARHERARGTACAVTRFRRREAGFPFPSIS
jgi:hypothetical protein